MKTMKKIFNVLILLTITGIVFFSCKREKPNYIGPELGIATKNFKFTTGFSAQFSTINFSGSNEWFNASFNERVSWIITLTSLNSKATKTIKGYSTHIDNGNSLWQGGNTSTYFFQAGDNVVAELAVMGLKEKYYDTVLVTGEKKNYGSDVIVWWDMNTNGVAKNGTVYWYDYYDADSSTITIGVGERREDFLNDPHTDNDPVQGMYRSMEGKDGIGASDYFIGACSHTFMSTVTGFNTSLDDVYLNFYVRKRTNTSAMAISLNSLTATGDTSLITYDVGKLDFEGWKLISIKLSAMKPDVKNKHPFNPARIVQFLANLAIHTNKGQDQTGFDIDMITFTEGKPFNPDRY
jgi:hypothetical protein